MFYNYLIWGNWNPVYLWIVFFTLVLIIGANKNRLKIENSSPKRFRFFLYGSFAFVLYYVFIYNPVPKLIQKLFLIPYTTKGSLDLGIHVSAFTSFLLIIAGVIIVYLIYNSILNNRASKSAESEETEN